MSRRADLILHPVRMRIVQATARRALTAKELGSELDDVPQSSLYRHLDRLVDAGVLEVVGTRPVRGTVERTFSLSSDAAVLSPDEVKELRPDEHLSYLSSFLGSVLERASAFLDSIDEDPTRHGFGYRITPLWLTDDELSDFQDQLQALLHEFAHRDPHDGRRRRVLATVLVPDAIEDESDI